MLGQFQHQWSQVLGAEEQVGQLRLGEQVGADVDGQEAVRRQGRQQGEGLPDDDGLEAGSAAARLRRGEPAFGGVRAGPSVRLVEAVQGLVARDHAALQVDDRLEDQSQQGRVGEDARNPGR